jgi:hypothetical protein
VPRLAADAVGSLVDDKLKILLFRTFWSQDGDGQSAAPPIVAVKVAPHAKIKNRYSARRPLRAEFNQPEERRPTARLGRRASRSSSRHHEGRQHRAAPAHELFKNITGTGQVGPAA